MGRTLVSLLLRLVLAAGLLASVGARFKLLDAPASFDSFTFWTSRLWGLAPSSIVPALEWVVIVLAAVLGAMLLLGLRTRPVALTTGILFLAVGVAMALQTGIKAPFHAAVFTTAGAAFAVHLIGAGRASLDGG